MTKARTLADNFAADINGITAGTGITGGGTSGTVTVTNSMATAIDAKGDLVVGTGADTFSRLAVASTAGYLLSVDSAEATGLKWVAPAGGGALTLISTTSFSSVASQSINDVFSSTYTNYKIIVNCDTSINTQMDWRFRVSGSDDSNANYNYNRIEANGASTLTAAGSYSQTAGGIAYIATTQGAVLLEVFNPQASRPTFWHGLGAQFATSSYNRVNFAGAYNGNTSFTGFTLLPASGNITGEVSVYGYSK